VLIVSRQPGPSLRDALPQPSGEPIGDRFVLVGTLGEGGMGKVLAYDDRALERRVAVKILRDKAERGGAEALMREAQVLGGLAHPNILPVYDIGEDPEAGLFYVMPLVEQPTLEEALTALREGKTSHGRMLRLFIQVCQAIAYAHSRGVFHCDLKPPNVLLGSFGEVFVADWGFAHREGDTKRVRGGTPGYMPPEQLQKGGRVGPYTDVFALGVILYQLLTDKLPFPFISFDDWDDALKAGEPALAPAIQPSKRAKDRSVPPELDELCMRAIELDPTRRLSTATELATALESFLEGTKEKRRRQKRAADLTEQGSSLRASYEDLLDAQEQRERELTRLRAQVAPWASTDEKEELWHAEDGQFVIASLSARTFQTAVASLESAIEEVPDHASARAELANLYALEHERATVRRADLSRKALRSPRARSRRRAVRGEAGSRRERVDHSRRRGRRGVRPRARGRRRAARPRRRAGPGGRSARALGAAGRALPLAGRGRHRGGPRPFPSSASRVERAPSTCRSPCRTRTGLTCQAAPRSLAGTPRASTGPSCARSRSKRSTSSASP
jgi:serine/threonine protein kinase